MLQELVKMNRSYRRFHQEVRITQDVLKELVDLARLCPSASNRQPLKYMIVSDPNVAESLPLFSLGGAT